MEIKKSSINSAETTVHPMQKCIDLTLPANFIKTGEETEN